MQFLLGFIYGVIGLFLLSALECARYAEGRLQQSTLGLAFTLTCWPLIILWGLCGVLFSKEKV